MEDYPRHTPWGWAASLMGVQQGHWIKSTYDYFFPGRQVAVVDGAEENVLDAPDLAQSVTTILNSIDKAKKPHIREITDKTWFLRAVYTALMANGHTKEANIIMNRLLNYNEGAVDYIAFRKDNSGQLDAISLQAAAAIKAQYIPGDLFGDSRLVKLAIIAEAAKRRTRVDALGGPWLVEHLMGYIYSEKAHLKQDVKVLASSVFSATKKNYSTTCDQIADSGKLYPIMKVTLLGFLMLQMWDLGCQEEAKAVLTVCQRVTPQGGDKALQSDQDIYVPRWQIYFTQILALLHLQKNKGATHRYRLSMPWALGGYSEQALKERNETFYYWRNFAELISQADRSKDDTIDDDAEAASAGLAWALYGQ